MSSTIINLQSRLRESTLQMLYSFFCIVQMLMSLIPEILIDVEDVILQIALIYIISIVVNIRMIN